MNERQKAVAVAIAKGLNGICGAQSIAHRLGYRPARSGSLSVSSTLRAMQRAGLVGRIPPRDQWGHADYFLTDAGKKALANDE